MQKIICSVLAVILAVCAVHAIAAPSQTADAGSKTAKQEVYILARILQPLRQVVANAKELEEVIKELHSKVGGDMSKRQSAWDLDYGWGGGRFGKRGDAKKRYDMYGFGGGRFGRDVDHVDVDAHH